VRSPFQTETYQRKYIYRGFLAGTSEKHLIEINDNFCYHACLLLIDNMCKDQMENLQIIDASLNYIVLLLHTLEVAVFIWICIYLCNKCLSPLQNL
jgi:hypothetical protein